jgi:hypothetical protein
MSALGGKQPLGARLIFLPLALSFHVMRSARLTLILVPLIAYAVAPVKASACSFPLRHYSDREIKQMAEEAFAKATTVVDGEVISPMAVEPVEGTLPVALIKVTHTWKGRVDENIAPVAYASSCDISLEIKGQKVRILLNGTGIFTADQETNGRVAYEQGDEFDREIDRLVGAPRPADFTSPGGPPPPEK